ncbi:MAG: extracellular solute-binding protein [Candidatus Daviesbacteria bacterium]|nr:extracellular solute-binding protein [Candidatus Daviesbacteria bacterium]
MKKWVVLVIILATTLGIIFWKYYPAISNMGQEKIKQVTLTYWGLSEDEQIMRPLISAFESQHPNIKINFEKQSPLNYQTRAQTQIKASPATAGSPDIITIHESWLPAFFPDLKPAPDSSISLADFSQTFYPVARDSLVVNNKIYAMPLEVDGLALFYNDDILKAAGVKVPKSWQDFINVSRTLTVKNQDGQIQTAGASVGTTTNVDFWPEIIALLFLQQPGGDLRSPANNAGIEIVKFYTGFVTDPQNKTWDVNLPNSTKMFADGKLAFYFAPSSQISVIKELNPNLNFKVATVPQLPGKIVDLGSFWVKAVSVNSPNQTEAWEFLNFLAGAEVMQSVNINKPYSRVDLAGLQINDPYLGAYVAEGPYYKAWFLNSNTGDLGINEEMIKSYKEGVDGILAGRDPMQMLQITQTGVGQALGKYGVGK